MCTGEGSPDENRGGNIPGKLHLLCKLLLSSNVGVSIEVNKATSP